MILPSPWEEAVRSIDFSFEPIVNVHTGALHGVVARDSGWEQSPFGRRETAVDAALQAEVFHALDLTLRRRAVEAFRHLPHAREIRLFLPIDGRAPTTAEDGAGETEALLSPHGLSASSLCFVMPGHAAPRSDPALSSLLQRYRRRGFTLALDGFGGGASVLESLYRIEADLLILGHGVVHGLAQDPRRRMFLTHLVHIAHALGMMVIGTGVAGELDFRVASEAGCDLVGGPWVGRARRADEQVWEEHWGTFLPALPERRGQSGGSAMIFDLMETIPPLSIDTGMNEVFARFRQARHIQFMPVINPFGEPLGVVREHDLKGYVYSLYGKDLLANRSLGRTLKDFVSPFPIANVEDPAERILEIFALDDSTEGILLAQEGRYAGFLSAKGLLRILHDQQLVQARDQNPLTRLPGNYVIHEFTVRALEQRKRNVVLVYLDFDDFKPFNDTYGFREGDRAIRLFADLLRTRLGPGGHFLGHVGGDDFFVGMEGVGFGRAYRMVRDLLKRFRRDVESCYDPKTRKKGYLTGHDRQGRKRRFALMGASAVMVELIEGRGGLPIQELGALLADMKGGAKNAPKRICACTVVGMLPAAGEREERHEDIHLRPTRCPGAAVPPPVRIAVVPEHGGVSAEGEPLQG